MKILIKLLVIVSVGLGSCTKDENVAEPEFDVSVRAATVKVGEPVNFYITGNPDLISFWSGERTHIYANNAVSSQKGVRQWVQFETQSAGTQPNNLKLMASTDFNGIYDAENVTKATWKDITDRIPTLATNATRVPSGEVNLLDFSTETDNKPVYLGFYYSSPKNNLDPTRWIIVNVRVNNVLANGITTTFAPTVASTLFKAVYIKENGFLWDVGSGIVSPNPPTGAEPHESWIVSGPIDLNRVGTADFANTSDGLLKGLSDAKVQEYNYSYTAPGKYTVTFVASNVGLKDKKTMVKNIEITVVP